MGLAEVSCKYCSSSDDAESRVGVSQKQVSVLSELSAAVSDQSEHSDCLTSRSDLPFNFAASLFIHLNCVKHENRTKQIHQQKISSLTVFLINW